jgi:DNA-binding transcriptional ArsR family regulator
MIPESRLIKSELTIRELALPDDVLIARKSLIRWVALSLGMILPNESRTLILDIIDVIFEFHVKGESPTTKDIIARLEENSKEKQNSKAVYYHLQKLKEAGIIKRKKGRYQLGEGEESNLSEIFRRVYMKKADEAFSNIGVALEKLEGSYR